MAKLASILFAICLSGAYAEERPTVSLDDGLIRGTYKMSYHGRKFAAFEGIPYAQPPIKNLRFKDPEPVVPWKGVLDATSHYKCLQLQLQDIRVVGGEDCLYLNVYVPKEKFQSGENLNVLVHIHGGAFMLGDPNEMSGPSKLMDRDIVYINFNYRLGPLGFYSTGDSILPGNYGLKDQAFALQWVQKNIDKFGGNPKSVTLTGSSAGAASVHLHYFSQLSKGLFHRAWAGSSSALNPWVVKKDPSVSAKILAKEVGCNSDSVELLAQCLRERPAMQIQDAVKVTYKDWLVPLSPFGPTIEPNTPTSFLTTHPYASLISAGVVTNAPLTFVTTTGEGLLPSIFYYQRLNELNQRGYSYNRTFQEDISEKISEYYFDYDPITAENFDKFVKVCGQRLFENGIEKSIKLHGKVTKSDVFFIRMDFGSTASGLEHFGLPHAGDSIFYYDVAFQNSTLGDKQIKMKDILLDMLVKYAETGKLYVENVELQSNLKREDLRHLFVKGPGDIRMQSSKTLGGLDFWNSLGLDEDENLYGR
ncbi:Carboxylesterase family [Popillia japonica]|uniref:Carboxylic ester hydrolase n=1 Tax=Popillia japonica TaxID=7064 RepID=A0AAW1LVQ3_POPJA